MNWEGLAERMRRLFELAPTIVSLSLGIVLVAQGIYGVYTGIRDGQVIL